MELWSTEEGRSQGDHKNRKKIPKIMHSIAPSLPAIGEKNLGRNFWRISLLGFSPGGCFSLFFFFVVVVFLCFLLGNDSAAIYARVFSLGNLLFLFFFFSVFFSALLPHPRHLIILFSAFSVLLCSFLFSFFLGGEGGKGPDRLSSLSPDKNEKLSHDQKLSLLTKKTHSLSPDKTFFLSLSLSPDIRHSILARKLQEKEHIRRPYTLVRNTITFWAFLHYIALHT